MKFCAACGAALQGPSRFCVQCGAPAVTAPSPTTLAPPSPARAASPPAPSPRSPSPLAPSPSAELPPLRAARTQTQVNLPAVLLALLAIALMAGGITFLLLRDDAPTRRGATTVQLQP